MSEIVVRNFLFHAGISSFNLTYDGSTHEQLVEHCNAVTANGCNTVILSLNNEDWTSFFLPGHYMDPACFDMARWLKFVSICNYIHGRGCFVCWALFDGPEVPAGKYHPILRLKDKHPGFIQGVCQKSQGLCDFMLVGIETNRYFTEAEVDAVINVVHSHLPWMLIGSHEQCTRSEGSGFVLTRNLNVAAAHANYWCYETQNHPFDGNNVAASRMAAEVAFVAAHLPCLKDKDGNEVTVNGKPFRVPLFVAESNRDLTGQRSREQVSEYSKVEGVFGASGPGL